MSEPVTDPGEESKPVRVPLKPWQRVTIAVCGAVIALGGSGFALGHAKGQSDGLVVKVEEQGKILDRHEHKLEKLYDIATAQTTSITVLTETSKLQIDALKDATNATNATVKEMRQQRERADKNKKAADYYIPR